MEGSIMLDQRLEEGTRVRLRAPSSLLRLASNTGRVVRETEDDGYYIIRLDAPALYDHGGDGPEVLHEVCEDIENLDILAG